MPDILFDKNAYTMLLETHKDVVMVLKQLEQLNRRLNQIESAPRCPVSEHSTDINELDERLSLVEKTVYTWTGRNAAIGFMIVIILQTVIALVGWFVG